MTNLSRQVRKVAKNSSSINGVVVDVFGANATVRLSTNGSLLRNLKVMGGPVAVGQEVDVSFSSSPPVVMAYGAQGLSSADANKIVDTARTPFIAPPAVGQQQGGHIIMDSTSTYTQRANLKFVGQPSGVLDVSDDSDNDATVVTVFAVKIYHNTTFVSYATSINFVDGT